MPSGVAPFVVSVIFSGRAARRVKVTRRIRQMCPLSPLLYVIYAEGLANLIRNDIRGISLPNTDRTLKLIPHADDTTIFITEDEDFNVLKKVFTIYSKGTGSRINIHKS